MKPLAQEGREARGVRSTITVHSSSADTACHAGVTPALPPGTSAKPLYSHQIHIWNTDLNEIRPPNFHSY